MTADGVAHLVCALVFYGALAALFEQLGAHLDRRGGDWP